MRREDAFPLITVLLLAVPVSSCQNPEGRIRYEDLVVSGRLATEAGARVAEEHLCGDETRFASALPGGQEVELSLSLGGSPRLVVAACRPSDPDRSSETAVSAGGSPTSVHLVVRGSDGVADELRLPVAEDGWTEEALDLSALAGESASLHLGVEGPVGGEVLVSDLWVRHRMAEGSDVPVSRNPETAQILLVSVDTLRGDIFEEPSNSRKKPEPDLPGLGEFVEGAQTFTPHYAAATWTKPSHASLLTGFPVETHGALLQNQPLAPGVRTLAERLSAGGLRTVGLATDTVWLDPKFGFGRGFDEYRIVRWDADQSVRRTVSWIARHRHEPFFYFLHLFTPHSDKKVLPYEATGLNRKIVADRFGVEDYGCRRGACASGLLLSLNAGRVPLIPGEEEILRFLYARGVETVDRALARMFDDLDESGLLDPMLVVVTSDHGEAFFEHGKLLHSTLHEEILKVPLFVRWPGGEGAGEVRSVPTSSIDIAPTLLRVAGLPAEDLPGRPLQELSERDRRQLIAGTSRKAVLVHPWKAIFSVKDAASELYHLGRDPAERHDLSAEHPEILERLRERAIDHVRSATRAREDLGEATATPTLSPEERRLLEALGYVE